MTGVDTRNASRDSLFLLADIRVEGQGEPHRVRVRNLSAGGMMGEGTVRVQRGDRLEIELRNTSPIEGSVAWVQDNRFGVAFDVEIDAQRVRKPAQQDRSQELGMLDRSWAHRSPTHPDPAKLKKI